MPEQESTSAQVLVDEEYQHWNITLDSEQIAWLSIDCADDANNTLGEAVLLELERIVSFCEQNPLKGLVIQSAKDSGFIAGADVREFDNYTDAKEITEKINHVHSVFTRLEALNCTKVAAVSGFCLGGGLELALCCDYIIAQDRQDTRIGLPEVNLGIFPGFGGSVRLTDRIGGMKGLELMLTGRLLRARPARALGVIDQVIGQHQSLYWHARKAVLQKRKKSGPNLLGKLSNTYPARLALASVMTAKTRQKARSEHYPAPFRLIQMWRDHRGDRSRMFTEEARAVGELMVGDTARNLRRVFQLMERLKALGKEEDFPVRRVHVIGAGVMGGDIAAWCVVQGMEVSLQDRELKYITPALERAKKLFKKRMRGKAAFTAAQGRLIADVEGKGARHADVIIEAIFEDPKAKQELLQTLEPQMKEGAILASNTSAIPLETLGEVLEDPSRLIGLHFFNPVAKMPLVEVVHSKDSDPLKVRQGSAFCGQINRFPLPVKSSPGFLVNRVLAPYLIEAMRCYTEGIDKNTIDEAAKKFGMPMGPVELADIVGLDVCIKVAESLAGDDLEKLHKLLNSKVSEGKLGKKSGSGFYEWKNGKAVKEKTKAEDVEEAVQDKLATRLIKPFLDECVACRDDEIVSEDDLLDAGIIFGTGFAPFRGGPLHYLSTQEGSQR